MILSGRHVRTRRIALALACAVLWTAWAAGADPPRKRFHLPEGDAAVTLRQFSKQAGEQIVYPIDLVRGVKTNSVRGDFTPRQVLDRMTVGTGLVVTQDERTGALSVGRRPPTQPRLTHRPAESSAPGYLSDSLSKSSDPMKPRLFSALTLLFAAVFGADLNSQTPAPETKTLGRQAGSDTVRLAEFTVSTGKDRGYAATNSVTATGIGTEIAAVPISISVVNEDFLKDSLSLNVNDALARVAGFNGNRRFAERGQLRGYAALQLRNGFEGGFVAYSSDTVARYEVIRGPSSVFHGQVAPGGVVNYLTKAPTARRESSLRFTYGSWDFKKAVADTGGPIDSAGKFKYRLIAQKTDADGWRDYTYLREDGIYGSFTWEIGRRADLRVNVDYVNHDHNYGSLLPATHTSYMDNPAAIASNQSQTVWVRANLGDDVSNLNTYVPTLFGPTTRNPGGPDRYDTVDAKSFDTALTVRLGDRVTFQNAIEGAERVRHWVDMAAFFRPFADRSVRNINVNDTFDISQRVSLRNELAANFTLGPTVHKVLGGVSGWLLRAKSDQIAAPAVARWTPADPDLRVRTLLAGRPASRRGSSISENNSYYLNDQMSVFGDRARLFAGVRRTEVVTQSKLGNGTSQPKLTATRTTPQFGLSVQVVPGLNAFANYSEAFLPNTVIDPLRGPLGPRPGEGSEFGLKLDTADGKWSGTFSAYHNEESNQPITDFALTNLLADGRQYFQPTGGRTDLSGYELEIIFTPTTELQFVGSYSYIPDATTTVSENAPAVPGRAAFTFTTTARAFSTPEHTWSLWGKYVFVRGPLKGLSVGGGPSYTSEHNPQRTVYSRALFNPSVTLFDAFVSYTRKSGRLTWEYSLNAKNLTDELYWIGDVETGDMRRVYFSAGVRF